MGFLGVNLPSELGGLGLSHLDAVLVLEEVAKISPAVAFPIFESCFGPTLAIAHFAPDELKQRIVPKVCAGEMIVAVSMSEPDAGTALTDLTTKVETNGDTVVVNGTKRWCSGAGHADAYVVYCRMSDEPGAKGIGAVLVEKDRAGLSFGKPEYHMGFRGIPSADIYLDKVEVSVENIVVPAGGFRQLMEAFDLERCGQHDDVARHCSISTGLRARLCAGPQAIRQSRGRLSGCAITDCRNEDAGRCVPLAFISGCGQCLAGASVCC